MQMRHNNTYILPDEKSDAQTETARPENAGVKADWHTQPSSWFCFRHSVQTESILRSQGSSSGPLRDAAPTQRGGSFDRRCGNQVWRFAPHCLSGPGGIPASWPQRTTSQAPWAQRTAQTFGRRYRVRARLENCRSWIDDCRLRPSRSGEVRNRGSPPQPGTCVGEQKKTAQSGVTSSMPDGAVEAYEALRRQSVQPDGRGEHLEGRGVLMRCGLATWAQLRCAAVSARPPQSHVSSGAEAPALDSFGVELVRLVAGLILSARLEGFLHA